MPKIWAGLSPPPYLDKIQKTAFFVVMTSFIPDVAFSDIRPSSGHPTSSELADEF